MTEETTLDPERQEHAKEYERIQRRLMVVDLAIGAIYTLAWLFLGWSQLLKDFLTDFTRNDWLLVIGFIAVFGLIYYLIGLPLSFYRGFILPHRYDLSNQTIGGWIVDQAKSLAVGGVLGGLILEIIYLVLRLYPQTWWLWAAGIMLLFSVILANLAPVLLMPLFFKMEPLSDEYEDLKKRLIRLAEQAGTKVKGVYKIDMSRRTKAANAALTGLGNTRRILLGDTLLENFENDEIETVLAHELGHHVHNDIPLSIAIESVITLAGFYLASLGLRWGVGFFGFEGVADIAAFPWFMIIMGAFGLVTMPLTNTYSRWRERLADRYALETTEMGSAYASALKRLANQNLANVDPEPWAEFILYSHPALEKRIEMAQRYSAQS